MNTSKIIKSLVEDNAEELASSVQECLEEKTKEALVKTYQEVSESILTTTEIDEENSFVSIISECIHENADLSIDLPDGERIEINPDIANFLSETHDSLPKDLQKSFRESIFDSKDKFIRIMESLIEDQEGEDQ